MGQFLPMLALGTAATATTAATAGLFGSGGVFSMASTLSTLGTGFSMLSSVRAGQAQQVQYEMQADAERVASRDREIQRKQRLVSALASQNAARAAQGIRSFEGSPAAMMRSDIGEAEYGSLIGRANTDMKVAQYQQSGQAAMQSGLLSAGTSLLDYGTRRAERG